MNILRAKVSQVVQIPYFYEVEVPSTVKIQAARFFQKKKTFQGIAEKSSYTKLLRNDNFFFVIDAF